MKKTIFFICNRYTANQDIIEKQFGRQVSFAKGLVDKGYAMTLFCADYKKKESFKKDIAGITYISEKLTLFSSPLLFFKLLKKIKKVNPDIIIGGSVPLWGFVGYVASLLTRKKYLYDIQDNYEITSASLGGIFSYLLHKINLVFIKNMIVVSKPLQERYGKKNKNILIAPNGINLNKFKPLDRNSSRRKWKFENTYQYIGYCGSLATNRGIPELQKAFIELSKEMKNVKLILAGGVNDVSIIDDPNINYLGNISPDEVPSLLNALDLVVIPNPENEFTRFCFPYKILEAMACEKGILTSKSGVLRVFNLSDDQYWDNTKNIHELSQKMKELLKRKTHYDYKNIIKEYSNQAITEKLDEYLSSFLRRRIAIICDNIDSSKLTGTANYALQLVNTLQSNKDLDYYVVHKKKNGRLNLDVNKEIIIKDNNFPLYSTLRKIVVMPFVLMKKNIDLVHETYQMGPFILPLLPFKKIVTIHDIFYKTNPQTHGFASKLRHNLSLPIILRHIDYVITDSEHSKKDILKYFHLNKEKISVVHLGVSQPSITTTNKNTIERIKNNYKLPKKFILTVCSVEPRKNILGGIKAIHSLLKQGEELYYVIVGKKTYPYFSTIEAYLKENNLEKNVLFLDYVSNEDLPYLYLFAYLFLFPTFYEGFGLPVLEAMSLGCPVVSSNISSIPEIAIGSSILVDPNNNDAIANAVSQVYNDNQLRKELIEKGYKNAKQFTWQECATNTEKIYERVLMYD